MGKKPNRSTSASKRRRAKATTTSERSRRPSPEKKRGKTATTAAKRTTKESKKPAPSTRARNRDDFAMPVLRLISQQVSLHCSNPTCWAPTVGPSMQKGISNVGVGAHITAAARGGPRYNSKLTSAQRRSATNALWLCNRCGRLVDNDTSTYTVPQLRRWKRGAIDRAHRELASGGRSTTEGLAAAQLEIQKEMLAHQRQTHEAQMRAQQLTRFGDMYSRLLEEAKAYADAIESYWTKMYVSAYEPDRPTRETMRKPIADALNAMKRALEPILLADSDETRTRLRWELIRSRRFEPTIDTIANQRKFADWIHYHLLRLRAGITQLQDNVRGALGHRPVRSEDPFVERTIADAKMKAETADKDIQAQYEKFMRERLGRTASASPETPSGDEVRARVWNVLHVEIFECDEQDDLPRGRGSITLSFLREIWTEVLSRPIDELSDDFLVAWKAFRQVLMTCSEPTFYAIVECAGSDLDTREKLSAALERSGAPYRFIGDKVMPTKRELTE